MTFKRVFSVLLLTVVFYSCSDEPPVHNGSATKPVKVELATPSVVIDDDYITVSGTVEAVKTASVGTRMLGRITKMYVQIGDRVQKGELLFTIGGPAIEAKIEQVQAKIAQAQASLVNAKENYQRFKALYQENSATERELDNARLQYKVAQARLKSAKQQLKMVKANTRITAPFDGVITKKMMHEGSLTRPGTSVLLVQSAGGLRISAIVAENNIENIHKGSAADIYIPSTNKSIQGTVTQISPSSTQSGGQYVVKISLSEYARQGIRAGMFAHVSIEGDNKIKRIMIPVEVVVKINGLTGIYTVSANSTALLRWIRTGETINGKVEVISGLQPDEKFIVGAAGRLYDGTPVEVAE